MLEARRLSNGDEHKWVERQATKSHHSSGWISTQRSLEAQGYHQGNRDLWLLKPEFTAYKVPSTTDFPTTGAQKRQQRTQQQRRKKRRSKPRRRPPTMGQNKTQHRYVPTWIPKDSISQISAKGKSHLVWILARREESKAYQEWIVPDNLLQAQGYYKGNTQLWLPKPLLQSQTSHLPFPEEKPRQSKPTKQWRPITTAPKEVKQPLANKVRSINWELKWVPKKPSVAKPEISSKKNPKPRQQWVPKRSSVEASLKSTATEPEEEEPLPRAPSRLFKIFNPIFDLLTLMSQ